MRNLVGKAVMRDTGEYFRTGEIVDQIQDSYVLVRFDVPDHSDAPLFPLELVSLEEIALARTSDGIPFWSLFTDREEFDEYMEWLETPSKRPDLTVVSIKDA
jgi:hypothetical protein